RHDLVAGEYRLRVMLLADAVDGAAVAVVGGAPVELLLGVDDHEKQGLLVAGNARDPLRTNGRHAAGPSPVRPSPAPSSFPPFRAPWAGGAGRKRRSFLGMRSSSTTDL